MMMIIIMLLNNITLVIILHGLFGVYNYVTRITATELQIGINVTFLTGEASCCLANQVE